MRLMYDAARGGNLDDVEMDALAPILQLQEAWSVIPAADAFSAISFPIAAAASQLPLPDRPWRTALSRVLALASVVPASSSTT